MSNIVVFDALDLADILLRAERIAAIRRVIPSTKEFKDGVESFERHYLGVMGEKAVEKFYNIQPNLRLCAGGDGGVDHVINGWHTQTKLRTYQGRDPELIFRSLDYFSAEVAVVTRLESPVSVAVVGCITKQKFIRVHKVKDYGYGEHFCCDESELSDPRVLITTARQEVAA